jgi:ATP-binding cassette subfamily G (WHITE) protein 2 (SNQ2)
VIAFAVLYILVTVLATEFFDFSVSGGGAIEYKKSKVSKKQVDAAAASNDEEKANEPTSNSSGSNETLGIQEEEALQEISGSDSVFTWENVEYSVPYMGGTRKLLNKVDGYAKPGVSRCRRRRDYSWDCLGIRLLLKRQPSRTLRLNDC